MIKHNQNGAVSGTGISLVLAVLLLIVAIGFGGWAFTSRQHYKTDTDAIVSEAVEVAKKQEATEKDKQFVQQEKNPLRTYAGPDAYGSLNLSYPKTWSGVVSDGPTASSGGAALDGYFYPNIVPSLTATSSTFALRAQVLSQSYADVLKGSIANLQQNQQSPATIVPYALPKVPNTVGIKINGALPNQKTGVMVVLPLRSQTLEVWTEGNQFTNDFESIILPNMTFVP